MVTKNTDDFLQRIPELVAQKVDDLNHRLEAFCKQEGVIATLKAIEEFFGIRLQVKLVQVSNSEGESGRKPKASDLADARPPTKPRRRSRRRRKPKVTSVMLTWNQLLERLPAVVQKLGARGKKFTSTDVVNALTPPGEERNFESSLVTLALNGRLAGIEKVGTEPFRGTQKRNVYRVKGKVSVQSASKAAASEKSRSWK